VGARQYAVAAATIERALHIEQGNPLLWIELGRVRMAEGNAAQADGLYRKALTLAAGDGETEARAWGLIAESLRARGRNQEAAEAESHLAQAAPY
jgi:Flp pilus assembly protein TadD